MQNQGKLVKYCVKRTSAGEMAEYAQTELKKYIYLLTGECADTEPREGMEYRIVFCLVLTQEKTGLGEEGYEIRTAEQGKEVVISAETEQGLLYGVYGLLSDHYGVGFYFSGDAIPQEKKPLPMLTITERRIPEQYIRGVLPWTNFPQSATSYSVQDWMFMIDQMTRMRMNFINIHNYNGEFGHNEMFHNIMLDGKISRNWNATVSKPHAWGIKGWNVNEYLFGGKEVFDDYDFGADAALHNDCLENIEVFQKGSSELAFVIRYAHRRGVKIGLGLDLNLVMGDYGQAADDFRVVDARIHQIITDYPNLDYLLLYRSENSPDFHVWNRAFYRTYDALKEKAPNIRVAVSGWGLDPDTIIGLPEDVIAAPISGHSVNDRIPDGDIYGKREFWGCPWSERDYNDSIHFAPYRTLLSNTVADYQKRSKNMKGLMTLTWRVSDGVDAKLSYIAEAPWDTQKQLVTSRDVYYRYAQKCYGAAAAGAITEIINENEAYATNASECVYTPLPSGEDRSSDIAKADQQLAVIEHAIAGTPDEAYAARLRKLYCRIRAVKAFCRLDENIGTMSAEELKEEFGTFVNCFVRRIDDISTLGNLFSVENRYVQEWYLKRMEEWKEGADTTEEAAEAEKREDMQVLVISPVTVIQEQSYWDVKATVIGGTRGKEPQVMLCYREAGSDRWNTQILEHRVRGVYGIRIPVSDLPEGVVEYYVEASDGETVGRYPAAAPQLCAALSSLSGSAAQDMAAPILYTDGNMRLRWKPCDGEVLWYRIYRGAEPDFTVGPQSLVTYVYRDTLSYLDVSGGFDGMSLSGNYYYRVSCVDRKLKESAPSNVVCCKMDGIGVRGQGDVQGKGASAAELGAFDFGENTSHFYLYYGATEEAEVELWAEGGSLSEERKLGTARLCATGRAEVSEMGDIALTESCSGMHKLSVRVRAAESASWKIFGGCPARMALREPVILTDADSFAISADRKRLELTADHTAVWKVKAPDGTPAEDVNIDRQGVLTAGKLQNVRVVSESDDGIVRERWITAVLPKEKAVSSPFRDFFMISDVIGCNEDVEIGGLVYGYQYTCQVSADDRVVYEAVGEGNQSIRIPERFLVPGQRYTVQIAAENEAGMCGSVRHDFRVSEENVVQLNAPALFGVSEREGSYSFVDEWNVTTASRYEILPEGFCLSTGEKEKNGRFIFKLPWKYTPEYPYLLMKAETLAGDWTMQINYVPVVGPKENNVAVRKDLRTFGFQVGEELELMLFVTRTSEEECAKTIFRSLQLLPAGGVTI